MTEKKPQILRDLILIGTLILFVGIAFILYYALKPKGELAIVAYDNQALFKVNMESGETTLLTASYTTDEMPKIDGEKLMVKGEVFEQIKEGEGVLIYKDGTNNKEFFFVKGNLGYVKIYYNKKTKKMRVDEETSPYNVCSKQGESNDVPIVCLPNFITIKFTKNELDDVIWWTIMKELEN